MRFDDVQKKWIGVLLTIILLSFGFACGGGGGGGSSDDGSDQPIIPSTTKPLDETTTPLLSSVSSDSSIYTFDGTTSQLGSLASGDVIVVGVTDLTPYGALRKIQSVTQLTSATAGTQTQVQTTQATLDETITKGSMEASGFLSASQITKAVPLVKGASLKMPALGESSLSPGEIFITFDETFLSDQIEISGNISLTPEYYFSVDIDNGIKKLVFTDTTTDTANLQVVGHAVIPSASCEVPVYEVYFTPIVFSVGIVPIIMTPKLTIYVGVTGNIATVTTSITQQATLALGVTYENGTWTPTHDFTKSFQYNPPSVDLGCSVTGYVKPQLGCLLYGVTGPYANIEGYLELDANPSETPWWVLYGGLSSHIGVEVEIFSHVIAGYTSPDLIDFKTILAQAEIIIAAPSTLTATAASSSQINLSWSDNSNNEQGFSIVRKTGVSGTYGQIQVVGASVTAYQDTGLSAGTTYYYQVIAYRAVGSSVYFSNYSNEANATTQSGVALPASPSNLIATATSSSQINLSWLDNSNNEQGFRIERKTGSSGSYSEIGTVGANVTTYQNTGLSASTQYYYRVRAYNTVGNSAYSNEANATTDGASYYLTVTAPAGGEIWQAGSSHNITWTSNVPGDLKIETYNGTSWTTITTSTPNNGSYSWSIPVDQTPGDYYIFIRSNYNTSVTGYSGTFSIATVTGSITVTSPSTGNNWKVGTTHSIVWTSANVTGNVKIELYNIDTSPFTLDQVLASNISNTGIYEWPIPFSTTFWRNRIIKISSLSSPSVYGYSGAFYLTGISSIIVTSPQGGDQWQRGTTKTITWTSDSGGVGNVKIDLVKGTTPVTIKASTPDNGSWNWNIPSTQAVGSDYWIEITYIEKTTIGVTQKFSIF